MNSGNWSFQTRWMAQKHQSECLLKVMECPNEGCTETFNKQDMDNHSAFECSWRKVDCEYCQESFIWKNKQQHSGVCQKFPIQCTNNCGLRDILREKLVAHIRDECPLTEVPCEYKNLGCEEVFPRTRAKSHSESQVERHLNLALRGLEAIKYQFKDLVSFVEDQSQQIELLMSTVQEQSRQIEELTEATKAKGQSEEMGARQKVKVNAQPQQRKELEQEKRKGKFMKQGFKPKSISDIGLGMKVVVKIAAGVRGRGIVKYVNYMCAEPTPGGHFRWHIGVELDPGQEGNTDGRFHGVRYFTCAPNRGIFVDLDDVVMCCT